MANNNSQRAPNPSKFAPTCTRRPEKPKQTCTNSRPQALVCELRTRTNLHKFAPPRGRHPSGGPTGGGGLQIRVGLELAEIGGGGVAQSSSGLASRVIQEYLKINISKHWGKKWGQNWVCNLGEEVFQIGSTFVQSVVFGGGIAYTLLSPWPSHLPMRLQAHFFVDMLGMLDCSGAALRAPSLKILKS